MKLQDFTNDPKTQFRKTVTFLKEQGEELPDFKNMTQFKASEEIKALREYKERLTDPVDRQRISAIMESLELWKKAAQQYDRRKKMLESADLDNETVDSSGIVFAAREIRDKFKGMLESISKIKASEILEVVTKMKEDSKFGREKATKFSETINPLIDDLYSHIDKTVDTFEDAILTAMGKAPEGGDGSMDMEMDMDGEDAATTVGAGGGGEEGISAGGEGEGIPSTVGAGGEGEGVSAGEEEPDPFDALDGGLDGLEGAGRRLKDEG